MLHNCDGAIIAMLESDLKIAEEARVRSEKRAETAKDAAVGLGRDLISAAQIICELEYRTRLREIQLGNTLDDNGVLRKEYRNIVALRTRAEAAEAEAKEYRDTITWNTTCKNCAKILTNCYAETCAEEEAEAERDKLRDYAGHKSGCPGMNWQRHRVQGCLCGWAQIEAALAKGDKKC